ncbi:DUF4019 domain-containing protein [Sphingopyxis sp.]|uniref:DUF4019 domain-containing protein n=1 Tax=Sphingopyxis sp. TaxID=1908224 RepID=UPI003D0DC55C
MDSSMKNMTLALLVTLGLAAVPAASAQPVASSPATNPARAAPLGPSNFLDAALGVVGAVDRYEMAIVWDASSPVMKASVPKDRFIANVAQRRAVLGSIRTRDWVSVMRVPVAKASGSLPAGQYMSVRFATVGQNGSTMEEVVSFSLDSDGQWRLAGYTIQ